MPVLIGYYKEFIILKLNGVPLEGVQMFLLHNGPDIPSSLQLFLRESLGPRKQQNSVRVQLCPHFQISLVRFSAQYPSHPTQKPSSCSSNGSPTSTSSSSLCCRPYPSSVPSGPSPPGPRSSSSSASPSSGKVHSPQRRLRRLPTL